MDITVQIDRLILDGVALPPEQQRALLAAVEAELGRLLAAGGVKGGLAAGGASPVIRAPAIQIPAGADPGALGVQIAQSVYGGLSQ